MGKVYETKDAVYHRIADGDKGIQTADGYTGKQNIQYVRKTMHR